MQSGHVIDVFIIVDVAKLHTSWMLNFHQSSASSCVLWHLHCCWACLESGLCHIISGSLGAGLTWSCGSPTIFLLLQSWYCWAHQPDVWAHTTLLVGSWCLYDLVLGVASKVVVNVVFLISSLAKQSEHWEEVKRNHRLRRFGWWVQCCCVGLCRFTYFYVQHWELLLVVELMSFGHTWGACSVNHWRNWCQLHFYTCMDCYFVVAYILQWSFIPSFWDRWIGNINDYIKPYGLLQPRYKIMQYNLRLKWDQTAANPPVIILGSTTLFSPPGSTILTHASRARNLTWG